LSFKKIDIQEVEGHGTEIFVKNSIKPNIDFENIKTEIGMRFLTDPHFEVIINGEKVTFLDIPEDNINEINADVEGVGNFKITVIDVQVADKNTHQHGIAWHVKNRLVGECTWKGSGNEHLIDGRRNVAKRYIFIINADNLEQAVSPDWTYFINSDTKYKKAFPVIQDTIKNHLLQLTQENRETTFKEIEQSNLPILKNLGIVSREKWETFITSVQEECPSISQNDLEKLANLLANLEQTDSKFNLINILATSTLDELDNLNEVLTKWDINIAKVVLDEIEYRTNLLEKLQTRVLNNFTDEVQELQLLFHRGLWIFGPEYETIEYTSNVGMTKVIQELFGSNETGSRLRPDFAILEDSSVGLYSFPKYDETGGEVGIDRLTIVELKRPGVPLGGEEVNQSWRYVNELLKRGFLRKDSKVMCFVLGSELIPFETERSTKMEGNVIIQPLHYDTIMNRAKSRLLNLYDKVKDAPFLQDTKFREYMRAKEQLEIF
jgi:hypothetical protein